MQEAIGIELLRRCEGRPDALSVPVGGGGLIAGIDAPRLPSREIAGKGGVP